MRISSEEEVSLIAVSFLSQKGCKWNGGRCTGRRFILEPRGRWSGCPTRAGHLFDHPIDVRQQFSL